MKYILFFLSINVSILSIYLGVLYGLYIPAKNKYIQLNCTPLNATHTITRIQCKDIVFQDYIEGSCFYDKDASQITPVPTNWLSLLIIIGTLFLVSLLIFFISVFNKIRIHLMNTL